MVKRMVMSCNFWGICPAAFYKHLHLYFRELPDTICERREKLLTSLYVVLAISTGLRIAGSSPVYRLCREDWPGFINVSFYLDLYHRRATNISCSFSLAGDTHNDHAD